MHDRFVSYIQSEKLFDQNHRILLAVSGGMDSMTLCDLMRMGRYTFAIAHFNHMTRNGESDLDEAFVRKYAEDHEIPFFLQRKDINLLIQENQGGNFQNLARMHRYRWLETVRQQEKYDFIATAHHHNDQIETFLFHFSRGTGLDGLTGISARQAFLVRPMMVFTRHEIEEYVFNRQIKYRMDSSNASSKYSRNYIRHGIIPSFKILNEHFESNANTTIENLRSTRALYQHFIEKISETCIKELSKDEWELDTGCFGQDPLVNRQLCFEIIRKYGFNYPQACQILESANQRGSCFYSGGYELLIERGRFLIRAIIPFTSIRCEVSNDCFLPGYGRLLVEKVPPMQEYPKNPHVEFIDADKIQFPLLLRNKEDGDRFKPLGMKGQTKKLKDFFSDIKLNRFEKERALVLLSQQRVVWVIGYRLSEPFKITNRTKEVIRLEWKPE